MAILVIYFGTQQQLQKQSRVGGVHIKAVDCVRDLGVWLDTHLKMKSHVIKKCRSAFINFYNIDKLTKLGQC